MNIVPQNVQESWKEFIANTISSHDERWQDEVADTLILEEKSLYENGHLIREELYFEQNIEETEK